jgi:hypothetical protein
MGNAVRGVLASAGYSIATAAPELGMGVNTLSRRVNGLLPFTWPEIARVANLTRTPTVEIVATADRLLLTKEAV